MFSVRSSKSLSRIASRRLANVVFGMPNTLPASRNDKPAMNRMLNIHSSSGDSLSTASANASRSSCVLSIGRMSMVCPGANDIRASSSFIALLFVNAALVLVLAHSEDVGSSGHSRFFAIVCPFKHVCFQLPVWFFNPWVFEGSYCCLVTFD